MNQVIPTNGQRVTVATNDEDVELAKKYSTEKSGKFVNGVLDSIARQNNLVK